MSSLFRRKETMKDIKKIISASAIFLLGIFVGMWIELLAYDPDNT